MRNVRLLQYREKMHPVLLEAGLKARYPVATNNYIFMPFFVPLAHVGISVTQAGLRVTLNLRSDTDRQKFRSLLEDRASIDRAIDERLDWDDEKEWRQKSVVRAALAGGYDSDERTWPDQHRWAAVTAHKFEREFARRLA